MQLRRSTEEERRDEEEKGEVEPAVACGVGHTRIRSTAADGLHCV